MKRSESITKLAAALATAQGKFGAVVKGKRANMGKGGSYQYADLSAVCEAVVPVLSEVGIAVVQGSAAETPDSLETMMMHGESGEWISTFTPIYQGRNGGAQGYGSGVTYARRYALLAAVGVAPEDDDDGSKASGSVERPNYDEKRRIVQAFSQLGVSAQEVTAYVGHGRGLQPSEISELRALYQSISDGEQTFENALAEKRGVAPQPNGESEADRKAKDAIALAAKGGR